MQKGWLARMVMFLMMNVCFLSQAKYARELCWENDTESDDGVDVRESLISKVLFVLEEDSERGRHT